MTRHELKDQLQHDQFTDAVSGVVSYASSHRQNVIRISVAAVVILVLVLGIRWYLSDQAEKRQAELGAAMSIMEAQPGEGSQTYPTEDAKKAAFVKALDVFISKYQGTSEGLMAQYFRGTSRAEKGDVAGAESDLQVVAKASSSVTPLAKIALVNLYIGDKKGVEAQTLLQELIKDPSPLVSKAQAQILAAQINEITNPQAAKDALKSIDATESQRPIIKRAVEQLNSQLAK